MKNIPILLSTGRVDIYIDSESKFNFYKDEPGFEKVENIVVLDELKLYTYININYEELGTRLDSVLKEMKNDGTFYKLQDEVYDKLGGKVR